MRDAVTKTLIGSGQEAVAAASSRFLIAGDSAQTMEFGIANGLAAPAGGAAGAGADIAGSGAWKA